MASELTKDDLTKFKKELLDKIEKMIEKEVKSQLKDSNDTVKMKEIAAKAINNFLRVTYQKNNFWINDIK